MQARKDLLDARRRDIEETPGSRFLAEHGGRAVGLLKRPRTDRGRTRARARRGARTAGRRRRLRRRRRARSPTPPEGDGAILAIAAGGPVADRARAASGGCSPSVDADPAARGIVSTVLRDVYLAATVDEAGEQTARAPERVVRHRRGRAGGAGRDPHRTRRPTCACARSAPSSRSLAHDLSATDQQLRPRTARLEEIGGEVAFLQEQIDAADAEITDGGRAIERPRNATWWRCAPRRTCSHSGSPP